MVLSRTDLPLRLLRRGKVRDVYVSTSLLRELNGTGGRLHRLDPPGGDVTATWDPAQVLMVVNWLHSGLPKT